MKRLLLISPWFGEWPAWINFFVESCKHNPRIDWLIPSDQNPPANSAENVRFESISLEQFLQQASDIIGISIRHAKPYKLCDLKPFYGLIFQDELIGYRSFGYCDLDVIWGDIMAVYTEEILEKYEVVSSHSDRMSGHLSVFQNTAKLRSLCRRIPDWRRRVSDDRHHGLDEGAFTKIIRPRKRRFIARLRAPTSLFRERYSTPGGSNVVWPDGSHGAEEWNWKDGKLATFVFPAGLPYLHFMFWHSDRWRRPEMGPAPWKSLDRIVQCDWRRASEHGFRISPCGIEALE